MAKPTVREKLQSLLVIQLERSAELLKENQVLAADLARMEQQRDCWRKLYRKIRPDKKVPCDREEAMVIYGEIDITVAHDGEIDINKLAERRIKRT